MSEPPGRLQQPLSPHETALDAARSTYVELERVTVPNDPQHRPEHAELAVQAGRDPYDVFFDLMTVVESLCPTWPDKEIPRVTVGFLL